MHGHKIKIHDYAGITYSLCDCIYKVKRIRSTKNHMASLDMYMHIILKLMSFNLY